MKFTKLLEISYIIILNLDFPNEHRQTDGQIVPFNTRKE